MMKLMTLFATLQMNLKKLLPICGCVKTLHFLTNIRFCTSVTDNDKVYSYIIVITLSISALAHASDNLKYTQYGGLLSQYSHELWARPAGLNSC